MLLSPDKKGRSNTSANNVTHVSGTTSDTNNNRNNASKQKTNCIEDLAASAEIPSGVKALASEKGMLEGEEEEKKNEIIV